jgi:hypothetical protein
MFSKVRRLRGIARRYMCFIATLLQCKNVYPALVTVLFWDNKFEIW